MLSGTEKLRGSCRLSARWIPTAIAKLLAQLFVLCWFLAEFHGAGSVRSVRRYAVSQVRSAFARTFRAGSAPSHPVFNVLDALCLRQCTLCPGTSRDSSYKVATQLVCVLAERAPPTAVLGITVDGRCCGSVRFPPDPRSAQALARVVSAFGEAI